MSEVTRYKEYRDSMSDCFCEMEEDAAGEWVSYEAHVAKIAELEAKLGRQEAYYMNDRQRIAELEAELKRTQKSAGLMLSRLSKEDADWCRAALEGNE